MKIEKKIRADYPYQVEKLINSLTESDVKTLLESSRKRNALMKKGVALSTTLTPEGMMVVTVFGRNPYPNYDTLPEGGCATCSGWGCWECNYSGGY